MKVQQVISNILSNYDSQEIEKRLNSIFNGYLGCDTGDLPGEIQQNHHLILSIIELFRKQGSDKQE